jgi:phosphoglucosamine mutase
MCGTRESKVRLGGDGIRDIACKWPLDCQTAARIGCAVGQFVHNKSGHSSAMPSVLVGRDTRRSGSMLVNSLKTGLLSQGLNVIDVGVMTTPGVACLTRHKHAFLGLSVTASHNPAEYNGIKFIDSRGLRLQQESEIEALINECIHTAIHPVGGQGREVTEDLTEVYIRGQIRSFQFGSLHGLKLVVDCANGAASRVAPKLLSRLGAEVVAIHADWSGRKEINRLCGSERARVHPQDLIDSVYEACADYGLALDGDGDRLVVVDSTGGVYNGDDFLFVLAMHYCEEIRGRGNTIVTTHMANSGLEEALLREEQISTEYTHHGDKHLENRIWGKKYLLGSEQVGNVILNDGYHTAADSLYAALVLCGIVLEKGTALRELVAKFEKHPQVLASLHLASAPSRQGVLSLGRIELLQEQIASSQVALGKGSRVKVWCSSTECGLLRAMVEGRQGSTLEAVRREALAICEAARRAAGSVSEPIVLDLSTRDCAPTLLAEACRGALVRLPEAPPASRRC